MVFIIIQLNSALVNITDIAAFMGITVEMYSEMFSYFYL